MLLQNIRAKIGARLSGESEAGFTLIELLVVMLIMGILAAIALPAFFNQKSKAGDAKAKEYDHTAQVAMETYATEHGGSYSGAEVTSLKSIEPTLSSATFVTSGTVSGNGVTSGAPFEATANSYRITTEGSSSAQKFWVERTSSGQVKFGCEVGGKGGCPAGGNWENG